MPTREQVERVTNRIIKENQNAGKNVSREIVRAEIVKRAKRNEQRNK
jgi:hypothetical protein